MTSKKSDDAISPVIGVMLMLVVTVVIAAVVTIFATGVVGETEAAPVAVLDVEIFSNVFALDGASHGSKNLRGPDLWITHISGEEVDTKNIELRFAWTHKDDSGKDCSHYSTYSADGLKKYLSESSGKPYVMGADRFGPPGISSAGNRRYQALYVKTVIDNSYGFEYGSDNINLYFGDAVLTPGMKLTANTEMLPSDNTHTGSQFMDAIFNNYEMTASGNPRTGGIMEHLEPGTPVDVMIVHLPSNKAIYDKTVIVQ